MAEEIKVTEVKAVERNVDVAKAIISFYNHRTLCDINANSKRTQETVFKALESANGNIALLKEHIKVWLDANDVDDFEDDLERFNSCFTEFTPSVPINKETFTITDSLSLISRAVTDTIKTTSINEIKTDIMENVQNEVRNFIKSEYGHIEKQVVLSVNGTKKPVKGVLHEKFDEVLKIVSAGFGVYLVGPAGSGKNVLCKQVADALGLKFYFTNAVTQEYKLTGFTDAMGNYQPTQFYEAFTKGGLFMLDEIDASIPEVLTILNAALANGYFDFPAPIGYKEAHKDFHVIAAGNTSGRGADYQYVGRNQLDGASLDRFKYEEVDYCMEVENNIAGDIALADFCRAFRAASKKVGVNIIVSYRAIEGLAKLLPVLNMEAALKCCLIKDLEKDDLNIIARELPDSVYKNAINKIVSTM